MGKNLNLLSISTTNIEGETNRSISVDNITCSEDNTQLIADLQFEVDPVTPPDDLISTISIKLTPEGEWSRFEEDAQTDLTLGVYAESASYISSINLTGTGISKTSEGQYAAEVTDALTIDGTLTIQGNNLSKLTTSELQALNLTSGFSITFGSISVVSEQKVTVSVTLQSTKYGSPFYGDIQVSFVKTSASLRVTARFIEATPNITSVRLEDHVYSLITSSTDVSPSFTLNSNTSLVGTNISNRNKCVVVINAVGTNLDNIHISSGLPGTSYIGSNSCKRRCEFSAPASGVTQSKDTVIFTYKDKVIKTVYITVNWGEEKPVLGDILEYDSKGEFSGEIVNGQTLSLPGLERSDYSFDVDLDGKNLSKLTTEVVNTHGGTCSIKDSVSDPVGSRRFTVTVPAPASGVTETGATIQFKYNSEVVGYFGLVIYWKEESYTITGFNVDQKVTSGSQSWPPDFTWSNQDTVQLSNIENTSSIEITILGSNLDKLPNKTGEVLYLLGNIQSPTKVNLDISNNKIIISDLSFGGIFKEGSTYTAFIGIDNSGDFAKYYLALKYTLQLKADIQGADIVAYNGSDSISGSYLVKKGETIYSPINSTPIQANGFIKVNFQGSNLDAIEQVVVQGPCYTDTLVVSSNGTVNIPFNTLYTYKDGKVYGDPFVNVYDSTGKDLLLSIPYNLDHTDCDIVSVNVYVGGNLPTDEYFQMYIEKDYLTYTVDLISGDKIWPHTNNNAKVNLLNLSSPSYTPDKLYIRFNIDDIKSERSLIYFLKEVIPEYPIFSNTGTGYDPDAHITFNSELHSPSGSNNKVLVFNYHPMDPPEIDGDEVFKIDSSSYIPISLRGLKLRLVTTWEF